MYYTEKVGTPNIYCAGESCGAYWGLAQHPNRRYLSGGFCTLHYCSLKSYPGNAGVGFVRSEWYGVYWNPYERTNRWELS